jgi:catechol 2,3-dioxygenase-like lactoylglutathione lyase family enzyme
VRFALAAFRAVEGLITMRWMRGSALFFLPRTLVGIFVMQAIASPQQKIAGLTLNHFGIYVKDLDESTKFYTEKMGFRSAFSCTKAQYTQLSICKSITIHFSKMTPADKDHPAGFPHAGILADDLESTVMALQKEGLNEFSVSRRITPLENMAGTTLRRSRRRRGRTRDRCRDSAA